MPFQSEKQRRYLWANEPEIARDWADTYGSRIESNTGGISRLGFAEGPKPIRPVEGGPVYRVDDEEEEENPLEKFMRFMQGNAGNLSQGDVTANTNFLRNNNVRFAQNNPYRMTSGPFQGMNAPGSSAFGSKNPQEMAAKWMDKFGGVDHKTSAMQEKKDQMRQTAGYSPHHSYSGGGRIGFAERGSTNKEYLDFKRWFDSQQQQGQEESIHDLYQQYQRDKRDKKVYDQKHMAATGGIMRLGYAQGNPHTDPSSTSYGPPGSASRQSAPTHQPTSNLGGQGNGAVSGYIQEELKKVPESVSSKFLGNKIGGAVGIGGMLPQYMLGNMLFNKIKGNRSSLDNYQNNSEEETDQKLAKGTTWAEFLQDTSPAAAFDPAIHNSWQDVYQSWLNQNTFS